MASYFEELHIIDRPFVPVKVIIGGKDVEMQARRPSAEEQDAIDSFYANEYGRLLADKLQSKDGKVSERDRIQGIYAIRSKTEIIEQLLPTRASDIRRRAAELAQVDMGLERLKMLDMEQPERDKYITEMDKRMAPLMEQAREEIYQEFDHDSLEDLVTKLTELNLNLQVNSLAKRSVNSSYVFYTLYAPGAGTEAPPRAFQSQEQVTQQFTLETIDAVAKSIREAFEEHDTLPFESPAASEPAGPSPLPSDLEAEKPASGDSTEVPSSN